MSTPRTCGHERAQRPLPGGLGPIWEAQRGNCFHCGMPMLRGGKGSHPDYWTREHLFPRSRYGPSNVLLAHRRCNAARGDREPTTTEIVRAQSVYAAAGMPFEKPDREAHRAELIHDASVSPLRTASLASLAELWPIK